MLFKKKTDEAAQKKIAKSASSPQERMRAVAGITDQKVLFEVAVNDNDFGVS